MRPPTLRFQLPDQPADDLRLSQIFRLYLDQAAHRLSARTWEGRQYILTRFADDIEDPMVGECRKSDLETWLRERDNWNNWTKWAAASHINTALNWAVDDERIARNPFRGVRWRPGPPRRPMTEEVFRCLLRSTDAILRRVLVFLAETGARPGEMRTATWADVDPAFCLFSEEEINGLESHVSVVRSHPPLARISHQ